MWNDHHGFALFLTRIVSSQHSGVIPVLKGLLALRSSFVRVLQLQSWMPPTRHGKGCLHVC